MITADIDQFLTIKEIILCEYLIGFTSTSTLSILYSTKIIFPKEIYNLAYINGINMISYDIKSLPIIDEKIHNFRKLYNNNLRIDHQIGITTMSSTNKIDFKFKGDLYKKYTKFMNSYKKLHYHYKYTVTFRTN